MVIMENFCSPEYTYQQLWQEIDQLHLSYLELDESQEKIQQRNRLEDYIYEFLCISGHYCKFIFKETQEVLEISTNYKKDFSAYKAIMGFNAVQMYAGNLVSQPWRKEYRQLKTYCGFYKHQVEANLIGSEKLFECMDYKFFGKELLILEGPICPDRVISVSRDCLVAFVECQIMKSIWEELSKSFKISWTEILDFRKNFISTPEQCINALKSRHLQREHSRSIARPLLCPMASMNHALPSPVVGLTQHQPQEYIINGGYGRNMSTYNPSLIYNIPPVPTANLIEVDMLNSSRIPESPQQQENWDYVYRNLETQGYTKDLGERGDLLSPKSVKEIEKVEHKITEKVPTEDNAKLKNSKTVKEKRKILPHKNADKWSCKSCTFLNNTAKEICEMCGKSRNIKGDTPMEIGGAECTKCTLVNSKNKKVCAACGTSLTGSPTYI